MGFKWFSGREPVEPREPIEPFERLLWTVRRLRGERYFLTDLRLIRIAGRDVQQLALQDIADVHRTQSRLDRLLGTSTLVVDAKRRGTPSIMLRAVRSGAQLAALIDLLAGDPRASLDDEAVRTALAWDPRPPGGDLREALGAVAVLPIAIAAVVFGLHGHATPIAYALDDAIAPGGVKRTPADIAAFMEHEVMPWARETFAPLKGGGDRVTCETCHGRAPDQRGWRMPAVAALPLPDVKERGWETYSSRMDAQMRNAIYGYLADSDKQGKAAYMREVVVPGMARLLHRPPYDFTKSYDYNRSHDAIGCYHCHTVR
jgi:hypothetical protein